MFFQAQSKLCASRFCLFSVLSVLATCQTFGPAYEGNPPDLSKLYAKEYKHRIKVQIGSRGRKSGAYGEITPHGCASDGESIVYGFMTLAPGDHRRWAGKWVYSSGKQRFSRHIFINGKEYGPYESYELFRGVDQNFSYFVRGNEFAFPAAIDGHLYVQTEKRRIGPFDDLYDFHADETDWCYAARGPHPMYYTYLPHPGKDMESPEWEVTRSGKFRRGTKRECYRGKWLEKISSHYPQVVFPSGKPEYIAEPKASLHHVENFVSRSSIYWGKRPVEIISHREKAFVYENRLFLFGQWYSIDPARLRFEGVFTARSVPSWAIALGKKELLFSDGTVVRFADTLWKFQFSPTGKHWAARLCPGGDIGSQPKVRSQSCYFLLSDGSQLQQKKPSEPFVFLSDNRWLMGQLSGVVGKSGPAPSTLAQKFQPWTGNPLVLAEGEDQLGTELETASLVRSLDPLDPTSSVNPNWLIDQYRYRNCAFERTEQDWYVTY